MAQAAKPQVIDGRHILKAVLRRAGYASPMEALAEFAIFVHGDVVRTMDNAPMFRSIRRPASLGQVIQLDGQRVFCDDNSTPRVAFTLATEVDAFAPDMVTNHLYQSGQDWRHYTHPGNLVLTPAFLAKLTDGKGPCAEALRYRAYELTGYCGPGGQIPKRPAGYPAAWRVAAGQGIDRLSLSDRCWNHVWIWRKGKNTYVQRKDRAADSVAACGWGWLIADGPAKRGPLQWPRLTATGLVDAQLPGCPVRPES